MISVFIKNLKSLYYPASLNNSQQNCDNGDDKQNVNYCSGNVSEKSNEPKDDQDNCDNI